MKEFVNKLIGRLEEKFKYNSEQAEIYRDGSDKDAYFREKKDLYMDRANTYGEVMRIVNQLAEEYINISTDISTDTSSGWIACSERLPKANQKVLTCDKDGWISVNVNMPYIGVRNDFECGYYVAWMPLPAPYKEGVTENE